MSLTLSTLKRVWKQLINFAHEQGLLVAESRVQDTGDGRVRAECDIEGEEVMVASTKRTVSAVSHVEAR